MRLNSYLVRKEDWEKGTWRETEKWKFEQKTVAITYILRELLLNIAQLSTARQEQLWRHFSLGATLAFFVFCVPLSPEGAFWRRPGAAPNTRWKALDEIYTIYTLLHLCNPIERPWKALQTAPEKKLSDRSFCIAQHSKCRLNFVKHFRMFAVLFSIFRAFLIIN